MLNLENLRKDREPRYYRHAKFRQTLSSETCMPGTTARRPVLPGMEGFTHIFHVVRCEGLFPTRMIYTKNRRPLLLSSVPCVVAAGFGLLQPDFLRGTALLRDLLHALRYLVPSSLLLWFLLRTLDAIDQSFAFVISEFMMCDKKIA